MKLQSRPPQIRVNTFRLDADLWQRFKETAAEQGWPALSAMRQVIVQYAANPSPLERVRRLGGDARTGWFECDADAVAALQAGADEAGVSLNDALRELVERSVGDQRRMERTTALAIGQIRGAGRL